MQQQRAYITTTPAQSLLSSRKTVCYRQLSQLRCLQLTNSPDLLNPNLDSIDDSSETSTIDALMSRRSRQSNKNAEAIHFAADAMSSENASTSISQQTAAAAEPSVMGSPGQLEEEAEGEGAFNPETGEINWDCPCLGGMAHGPCGPQFREAFSCFVFSTEEPKGMDCIAKFEGMRGCFQEHPEVYKDELLDDEEMDAELEKERQQLAQEIGERKQSDTDDTDGTSQRRLLEETPPSSARPVKSAPTNAPPASQEKQGTATPTKRASAPPSEPTTQPFQSNQDSSPRAEKKDNIGEGQKSDTIKPRNPKSSSASHATADGDTLLPKAAHDARDAKASK